MLKDLTVIRKNVDPAVIASVPEQDLVFVTGTEGRLHPDDYDSYQGLMFVLDGVAYNAVEDVDDGYRSTLRTFQEVETPMEVLLSSFPPQRVRVEYTDDGETDMLVLTDIVTGEVVLTAGTDYSDSYYPCCILKWDPRGLAINQSKTHNKGDASTDAE